MGLKINEFVNCHRLPQIYAALQASAQFQRNCRMSSHPIDHDICRANQRPRPTNSCQSSRDDPIPVRASVRFSGAKKTRTMRKNRRRSPPRCRGLPCHLIGHQFSVFELLSSEIVIINSIVASSRPLKMSGFPLITNVVQLDEAIRHLHAMCV